MRVSLILILIAGLINANDEWWHDGITIELTEATLFEHIGKDKHVFIEFFAPYCIYCRNMQPEFTNLARRYMGESPTRSDILIAKVNCNNNMNICFDFQVRAYPDLTLFKKGSIDVNNRYYGDRSAVSMAAWLENEVGPEEKKEESPAGDNMNNPVSPDDQSPTPQQDNGIQGDIVKEADFDMNQMADPKPQPDSEPNLLDIKIEPTNIKTEIHTDNKPDASLASIINQIAQDEKKDEDPLENLNFKQRDVFEKMDKRMDTLLEAMIQMSSNLDKKFEKIGQFIEAMEKFQQSTNNIETQLNSKIEQLKGIMEENGMQVKGFIENKGSGNSTQLNSMHETHISITQALLFITIGTMVGVGVTFAFVNFRKLKKKKYLVD